MTSISSGDDTACAAVGPNTESNAGLADDSGKDAQHEQRRANARVPPDGVAVTATAVEDQCDESPCDSGNEQKTSISTAAGNDSASDIGSQSDKTGLSSEDDNSNNNNINNNITTTTTTTTTATSTTATTTTTTTTTTATTSTATTSTTTTATTTATATTSATTTRTTPTLCWTSCCLGHAQLA
eukprot:NODE_921_length_1556_cov_45.244227_g910_i0.p2 GENE.NODE_921_length_1556_cov_45.244227_g910_i0~~NODE_921_length_1556_cov_45.244227_g910_i0.p2  ORF type:complete len:184 (-),score=56.27 NODE_921_length_1556_cov_45.244227_g910_i0:931-1482(-)